MVFKVCHMDKNCYALRIQHDPHKKIHRALRILTHLKDNKYFLKVNKYYRRAPFNFVVETLADTNLGVLIDQNALSNMQKISLTFDLLESMIHYSAHKIVHGNIKPEKILIRIDSTRFPQIPVNMNRKLKITNYSNLESWLFGFDRHYVLKSRDGVKYTRKLLKKRKRLSVDFFDSTRNIRKELQRYESVYRPFESWFQNYHTTGPSADVYALGIVFYQMWFQHAKGKMTRTCTKDRLSQCKNVFLHVERLLDYAFTEYETEEECAMVLIQKMTRFLPYERAYPEEAKLMFLKCLRKLGFEIDDEEEEEDE